MHTIIGMAVIIANSLVILISITIVIFIIVLVKAKIKAKLEVAPHDIHQ